MDDRRTLIHVLQHRFATDPDRVAFVFLENGDTEQSRLTAGEIDRRARAIAAVLQDSPAPAEATVTGDRALLLYPSGPDFVCAYVGCLYAGVVPVPCSPPSRQRTDPRVAVVAEDAGVRWVLTSESLFAARDRCVANHPVLAHAVWIPTAAVPKARADDWVAPAIDANALALLQYTSGSTSAPRGVMVTHENLLVNVDDLTAPWPHTAGSVMVTWLPVFHDLGLIWGLIRPLVQGFLCVMMPPAAFLQRPARWLQAISRYRGTHTGAPNFAYDLCAARVTADEKQSLDLSSWRVALNGAEPIHAETLERFHAAFASCGLSATTMGPSYGLAEATLGVAMTPSDQTSRVLELDADAFARGVVCPPTNGSAAVRVVSCGPPAGSVAIRIVDPATREACDADRIGEVWLRGAAIAKGYWNNDAATQETFHARVATDEAGPYMRTGDLGFVRDGHLYITGRHKDLIILHGLNYYPQDIELTVERSHPALAPTGAAAFAVSSDGDERVVVYAEVQRTHLKRLDAAEIFAAIAGAVSDEHGISPWAIALLGPRTLPKTSSGKVRRADCRALFLSGELESIAMWRTPAPDIREWLIDRLAQRLHVPRAAIDARASFAMYGLTSVDAVGLSGDLEEHLQRRLSPTLVYDYPSIEKLAAHLAGSDLELTVSHGVLEETVNSRSDPASGDRDIAIVGMGCRFPGAANPDALWELLRNGVDAIRDRPTGLRRDPGCRGGFLDEVDRFDAAFFGISPREAERTDPQQRLLLEVAWEALEDAAISPPRLAGTRTGVFIGISNSDYGRMLAAQGEIHDLAFGTGSALSIAANRISYALDLRGPSLAVDTACSASLVATTLAVESLRRGDCDAALAGGVNLILSPEYSTAFARAQMLAADGRCKTFGRDADGYGRGEGAGVVVLKRLADAERAGDRILAVIRGVAVNQDGRTTGLTAPNGPAQQAVVRAALRDAGAAPAEIGYVEAHGTGTPLGDPIEVNALAAVLGEGRDAGALCRIGSIKTNIGHLESAAGIAALIKTVLCLVHREIPRTLHCDELNPRLEIEGTPIQIAARHQSWESDEPRLAGVSSFGFGGTNAHLVMQEYAGAPLAVADAQSGVLTLSARDPHALRELARRYIAFLDSAPDRIVRFVDICFTSNISRGDLDERLAITASSAAEASAALKAWLETGPGPKAQGPRESNKVWGPGPGALGPFRKVALPTYPFQRSSYWLPSTSAVAERASSDTYRIAWVPANVERAGRSNGDVHRWLVFADEGGTGKALARELESHGDATILVRPGSAFSVGVDGSIRVRPDQRGDYIRAIDEATRRLGGAVGCVHAWSLDAPAGATAETFTQALDRGSVSVILLLQSMLAAPGARLWIVTRGAQSVAERPSDSGLLQSPVWGVGKSAALELPEHWGGLIDVDDRTPIEDLSGELRHARRHADGEDHVAFRGASRFVARIERTEPEQVPLALRQDRAYLITGGLGTIGFAIAQRLARDGAGRLVLTGRSGAATDDRRRAVAALEASGVRVSAPAIDVTNAAALRTLCDELARDGTPLAGIVHAAGTAEQAPLRSAGLDAWRSVVRVKAAGALALRDAAAGQPVEFFISVSSMAAAWGAVDLSSYVAANVFLDVFAHCGTPHARVASIALGPVQGGLLPAEMARRMEEMGVGSWPPDRAADAFINLGGVGGRAGHVIAAEIDWARFLPLLELRGRRSMFDRIRGGASRPVSASTTTGTTGTTGATGAAGRAALAVAPADQRSALVVDMVSREVAAVLGLNAGERPDLHRGLFDLGMNSLMALELKSRLEALFGCELPTTIAFDHPNISALAIFVSRLLPATDAGSPAGAGPDRVDAAALEAGLARLERLLEKA